MKKTWVVVADSSRARFFEQMGPLGELHDLEEFEHPRGRMKGSELLTDSPGRAFDSKGAGRHAMSSPTDARRHEAEVFAGELADRIETARTRNKFRSLVISAPPEFLGLLRDKLSEPAKELITRTINKDLVKLKSDEIHDYVTR